MNETLGNRIDLSNTSLVTVACSYGPGKANKYASTLRAIEQCLHFAQFQNVVIFTDNSAHFEHLPNSQMVEILPWESDWKVLSQFFIKEMPKHRDLFGEFTMLIHWDGFIVNPSAWSNTFFEYDYIGAVWADGVMGNDGFHLRSKKVWDELAIAPIEDTPDACHPCDARICRTYRSYFESRGIKFAPNEIAHKFSVEDRPYAGSLGFHGKVTYAHICSLGLDTP